MAYTRFEQSEEVQREELIRKIENSVKSMSLRELEALCYELSTKNYISEREKAIYKYCSRKVPILLIRNNKQYDKETDSSKHSS